MSSLTRELVFLILQFLDEELLLETAEKLEQESGFFFNMEYFEDEVYNGNWDEVERYISSYTKLEDNWYSMKTFFDIRRQKYLEALDECDRSKAEVILVKDLKVFARFNEELFIELSLLLNLENFRENEKFSGFGETESMREVLLIGLKKLFEANPLFHDKLQFPNMKNSRLRTIIDQGLNWQHQLCKSPRPNPVIKTLFVNHSCEQPNSADAPLPVNRSLPGSLPNAGQFPPPGAHGVTTMSNLTIELLFLVLQFLEHENFKETLHMLERESGVFFNMSYFEDEVRSGNWDDVEKYLSGFTEMDDNPYSMKLFIEIGKQKHLEALDGKNEQLSKYGDIKSARAIILVELKKLIEANPLFHDKLQSPILIVPRLWTLINQGLNWQHQLCKNPRPNPDIKTLFVDHSCGQSNGPNTPTPANNLLEGFLPKAGGFPLPFQPTQTPGPTPLNWSYPFPPVILPAEPAMAIALEAMSIPGSTFNGTSNQVNLPVNVPPVTLPGHAQSQVFNAPYDLPETVARTLILGSSPISMDFHPVEVTVLLVGTYVGDIGLWEVAFGERLVLRSFQVWDISACSMTLQEALLKDPCVSVNRLTWSPDGSLFGVAYSRHIVQIYSYHGRDVVMQHLEIEAHVGAVNDIAFSFPNKQLSIVTCGDDKTIKVWDAVTGTKLYTFEGHEAPVYSIHPSYKHNIHFIFSTSLDGKLKVWLYDNFGSRVDFDAPGGWCTTMASSDDGRGWGLNCRLFSCGTSKDGESFLVEWNEGEGTVKRTYEGFRRQSLGVVQFDTSRNRFLAAGDDFSIKFWDMDNVQLLTSIDAGGGLPASPRIRFNKDGTLLAVSTNEYGIKILGNSAGNQLLGIAENLSYEVSRTSDLVTKPAINHQIQTVAAATSARLAERVSSVMVIDGLNEDAGNLGDVKTRLIEETNDRPKMWKVTESQEPFLHRPVSFAEKFREFMLRSKIYKRSALSYTHGHLKPQLLKDVVLEKLKSDWKKVAVILVFLILMYTLNCCAFGKHKENNAYARWRYQ